MDPFLHVHSFIQYKAAAVSVGFEQTEIVVATSTVIPGHREQAERFAQTCPRVRFHWLETKVAVITGRLHGWRLYRQAMREVESLLRAERFDRVIYIMADMALPFLGLPFFKREFAAHRRQGICGILFRDHGLRTTAGGLKARAIAFLDRFLLGAAVRSDAIRRLTFLDPYCADRARGRWGEIFGYGVDPMEIKNASRDDARRKWDIALGDKVILLFGAKSDRKGIVETLARLCAARLPRESTVLILAGPVDANYQHAYDAAVKAASQHYRIIRHETFVPEEDIPFYFAAADLVLCLYKNFNASSGVLLHAASMGKPVIVCTNGAMHDAVARFGFGEAMAVDDAPAAISAIHKLLGLSAEKKDALAARARRFAGTMDERRYLAQFETPGGDHSR